LKNLDTHNGEQIHNASTFNGVSFDFEWQVENSTNVSNNINSFKQQW
jgi:hypothetical protein